MNNFKTLSVPINSYLVPKNVISKQGAWGIGNSATKLGIEDAYGSGAPITTWTQLTKQDDWAKVSGYTNTMCVIKNDGSLWIVGDLNTYFGGGTELTDISSIGSLIRVGTSNNWSNAEVSASVVLAIKTDGTLWVAGQSNVGSLGVGTTAVNIRSMTQVGSDTNWHSVSAAYGVLARKTDGTLWAWGGNLSGSLGTGNIEYYSSPVQVGNLNNWSKISLGYQHSAAIKTDGTLWAWGHNINGELGLGDTINRSSPVQVGSDTNWSIVTAKSNNYTMAIKTDGTLWGWGDGSYGSIGDSSYSIYSSPIQVGALTNWKEISTGISNSYTFATKTDGTLWGWGDNAYLGTEKSSSYINSPVQIGSDNTWSKLMGGRPLSYMVAIKTPYTSTI